MFRLIVIITCLVAIATGGCRSTETGVRPTATPEMDLRIAYRARDEHLLRAIERSLTWFERPESHACFPMKAPRVTHARARASVVELRRCLLEAEDDDDFARRIAAQFITFAATGRDGRGSVLFTAYYAPEYAGSRGRDDRFRHPLYGPPRGWRAGTPWHPRRTIEDHDLLAGRELVWLEDPLDVYLVQVNGSARIRLPDGGAMHVGHAGTNERAYTSLGRMLIDDGLADEASMSMATIRQVFEAHPERVLALMRRNDRFVFFEELPADAWPRSALGIPLTPESSIATDKNLFPPGVVTLVRTTRADGTPFVRLMLDQDTGGAIKGPGRADLYFGVGEDAGRLAGAQHANGCLSHLILKLGP